jgi:hypothetical protein
MPFLPNSLIWLLPSLNGVVARPKRFELLTPDSRLVPVSKIRTILISDFCSGSILLKKSKVTRQ